MVLVTLMVPPVVGLARETRAAARAAWGGADAVSPRGISQDSPNWSLWSPMRKLSGSGSKVASVARSMAMGSDRPAL